MSSAEAALRRCWRGLAENGNEAIIDGVVARHREPHRRYHTAVHVMWVLRHVDDLVAVEREGTGTTAIDVDVVRAAALFHDVVYDPRSSTNEHESAELAAASLHTIGWDAPRVSRVASLIEATSGHLADDGDDVDVERAVLLDADMAILGSSPAEYEAYVNGVRAEYAHVPPDAWRTGRASILHTFLDRPAIYATPTMRATRERRARANLTAEVTALIRGDHSSP